MTGAGRAKDTFELWDGLKSTALQYAMSAKPLPTSEDCAKLVHILIAEHGFSSVPALAQAFYATELGDLIASLRASRPPK